MNLSTKSLVNICVLILVGFALGMFSSHWRAGHRGPFGYGPPGAERQGGNRQERMFRILTNRLDLNEQQQTEVKSILAEGGKRLKQLHTETTPKFDEIRNDIQAKLRAVMLNEQIEKFDRLQQMLERKHGRSPRFRKRDRRQRKGFEPSE